MATLIRSTTVSGGTLQHRITYSVANTDTATTVTLSKVEARFSSSGSYFPFALHNLTVACDGTTLYTHAKDDVTVYTTGTTWKTVATPNKTKSFTRGKTAATKSISLTYTGTTSANITVPAKPSYTIAYNANGGTGAPSAQTKWYGEALTLSSTRPTRTDFSFLRWNTNSAGSGTNYASGASYTANAAATLYAQWQRTYANPKVTINSVQRVNATTHEADDEGTSVAVTLSWNLFAIPSQSNRPTSVVLTCNGTTETLTTLTGITGTTTAYIDANCDPDQQYPVTVTLTDLGGASRSVTAHGVVTSTYYPIDIRQGGKGVAIGGPSNEDAFDVFMPVKVLPRSTSANEVPLAINDGTDDVFAVGWDGTVDMGGYIDLHDPDEHSAPGSPPSSDHYGQSIRSYDADGILNFYSQTGHTTADALYRSFVARRVVSGSAVTNGLYLYIDANGTRSVGLSDRAAWLSALGYTAPTALPLASACAAYDSDGTPRYARDGHVVSVWGTVKPTAEVAAGGTMTIGTLPAGYRPPNTIRVVCHGSYAAMWLLAINTDGTLRAERYSSNGETYAAMTTAVWMPFSATFITTS